MATILFVATGGYQYWTVPAGVTSVDVALNGGASAGGRPGGRVEGKLAVTPGHKLCIICGEQAKGHSGTTGGGTAFGAGGAGGNGKGNDGGDGGGGYSAIRLDSSSGTIKCVAGGTGGTSGDGGAGGNGGGSTGESGSRGSSGSNSTGAATGGTQSQGGNGGTSSSGSQFNGSAASDSQVARGGAGGSASNYCHGGGGGGGGWRSGGGGQASSAGYAPGGGGGGGSNYTGGITQAVSTQGGATTSAGAVRLTWTDPAPANQPPSAPTSAQVNGVAEAPGLPTKDAGHITISAIVSDPDKDDVRLKIRVSSDTNFDSGYYDYYSPYVDTGKRATYAVPDLDSNKHYYMRLWSQDKKGLLSTSYNSLDFYTNRWPTAPTLTAPVDNATILTINSVVFTWTHNDPDPSDPMKGWQLQYRTAGTANTSPGAWTLVQRLPGSAGSTTPTWTANSPPPTFKSNKFYEWQVRTIDNGNTWGAWSLLRSFYTLGVSTPPIPVSPDNNVALDVNGSIKLDWTFVDPDPGDSQSKADVRYRLVGQDDTAWVTRLGAVDPGTPGKVSEWLLPPNTFQPGYNYEWQVRTYDALGVGVASDWSESATFWTTGTPGDSGTAPVPALTTVQGALGCGEYRVYVYAQGGNQVLGEITPMSQLTFKRVRDDISDCIVQTNGFSDDCCDLYASLRCWMHEIVVFRSGVRVWEGPITRIGYSVGSVEIEAKDVMGYLYRRILRQGFNDAYHTVPGSSTDPHQKIVVPVMNVVQRAQWIIQNALAPHDPNILPYLTAFQFGDDAKQSRVIPDYSQSAWEQVDDMAATSGLDYTVVGRRIILWDTHRAIGRLPEMRDGDFSDPPVVTEYGMQLCNYMAVTNGSGVWGAVRPKGQTKKDQSYGPIEMVATGYSDSAAAKSDVMTQAALQDLRDTFVDQAVRNIAHRWPTPVVVRVPDNSTLSPEVGVGFDQLVPGVWIPLRSAATCREVVQWQKLDSVTVNVDGASGEQVQVVMSPAPNGGADPDSDQAAEDAS